ncbi:carotenoid ester lipase, variant 2 [Coprinopsis cinerea AmutBmut pab1-1]|nr:carotenoid ester lipase, variant 2 [Coprinopsis cinerea AmutBmut pab1-1]
MVDLKHTQEQLELAPQRVTVETRYGPVTGGRAANGAAVFLEIPYAVPPKRFEDPQPLPDTFRYPDQKEYIVESAYAAQPRNDGQAAAMDFKAKVGLGAPTENPNFPVKVYIHGGFLQFGSPHGLSAQAQYAAAEREEIWVNIGYRLSAFGFIASAKNGLTGNYGFKDQWLALKWIKANISAFGGNQDDIQLTGLSAGAHSVHQILHHLSVLPPGENAPFSSAVLQSNAMPTDPKTSAQLDPQFDALCKALGLDPDSPDILETLKDDTKVPASRITEVIEEEKLGRYGAFRGCLSDDWIITSPGPMERQHNGSFATSLRERGVKYIVVGEVSEEWYLYSIAHPISSPADITFQLERYFTPEFVSELVGHYPPLPSETSEAELLRRFGDVFSLAQVYLPVRVLARDLVARGFPVLRYRISWGPEHGCLPHKGLVTHGTDRALWTLCFPALTDTEASVARSWVGRVEKEVENALNGHSRAADEVLLLDEEQNIGWAKDPLWEELSGLANKILPSTASL